MRVSTTLTLVVVLAAGCARRDPAPEGGHPVTRTAGDANAPADAGAVTSKETDMHEVKSSTDLIALRDVYRERIAAGFSGTFEVHVAAGTYEPVTWELAPDPGAAPPAIDLVLRGEGASIPRPSRLVAASVRIEGLVVTGPVSRSIEVEAAKRIDLVDAAFIDGRTTDPNSRAPYLALRARGAITLQVERTWFVRNFQQGKLPGVLVGLAASPHAGGRFDEVVIRDSAFVGNAFATELELADALAVKIERTAFYKTWASGAFLGCASASKVTVTDSVLVAEDLAHVARVDAGCAPIELGAGTRVYARSYTPSTAVPASLQVDRAALADRAAIDATARVADDAAKRKPEAIPATLHAELMAALRP